jgi:hypothetical protein
MREIWLAWRFLIFRIYHKMFGYRYGWSCPKSGCYFKASTNRVDIMANMITEHSIWHIERKRPCDGRRSGSICAAEGCFGESCLKLKG